MSLFVHRWQIFMTILLNLLYALLHILDRNQTFLQFLFLSPLRTWKWVEIFQDVEWTFTRGVLIKSPTTATARDTGDYHLEVVTRARQTMQKVWLVSPVVVCVILFFVGNFFYQFHCRYLSRSHHERANTRYFCVSKYPESALSGDILLTIL